MTTTTVSGDAKFSPRSVSRCCRRVIPRLQARDKSGAKSGKDSHCLAMVWDEDVPNMDIGGQARSENRREAGVSKCMAIDSGSGCPRHSLQAHNVPGKLVHGEVFDCKSIPYDLDLQAEDEFWEHDPGVSEVGDAESPHLVENRDQLLSAHSAAPRRMRSGRLDLKADRKLVLEAVQKVCINEYEQHCYKGSNSDFVKAHLKDVATQAQNKLMEAVVKQFQTRRTSATDMGAELDAWALEYSMQVSAELAANPPFLWLTAPQKVEP